MALLVIARHVFLKKGLGVFNLLLWGVLDQELGVKHFDRVSGTEDVFYSCCDDSVSSTTFSQLFGSSNHLTSVSVNDRYAEEGSVFEHIMHFDHLSLRANPSYDVCASKVLKFSLNVTGLATIGASRHVPIGFLFKQFIKSWVLEKVVVKQKSKAVTPNEHNICITQVLFHFWIIHIKAC